MPVDGFEHRVMPSSSTRPGRSALMTCSDIRGPGTHEYPLVKLQWSGFPESSLVRKEANGFSKISAPRPGRSPRHPPMQEVASLFRAKPARCTKLSTGSGVGCCSCRGSRKTMRSIPHPSPSLCHQEALQTRTPFEVVSVAPKRPGTLGIDSMPIDPRHEQQVTPLAACRDG